MHKDHKILQDPGYAECLGISLSWQSNTPETSRYTDLKHLEDWRVLAKFYLVNRSRLSMAKSLWQWSMDSAPSHGWTHCTKSTWHGQWTTLGKCWDMLGTSNFRTSLNRTLTFFRPLSAMAWWCCWATQPCMRHLVPSWCKGDGFHQALLLNQNGQSLCSDSNILCACSFLRMFTLGNQMEKWYLISPPKK